MSYILDFSSKSTRTRLFSFMLSFALILACAPANAATTITGAGGASNTDGLQTATVTIFGGVAGTSCGTSDALCSNCNVIPNPGGTVADTDRLTPCNDSRINGNVNLSITIQSDAVVSGYPAITLYSTAGTTTNGPLNVLGSAVSKGNPGTIIVPWNKLCALMTPGVSGGTISPTTCDLNLTDTATGTFAVGFKATNDSGGFATGDEAQIQVKVVVARGPTDSSGYLSTTTNNGITNWDINSGDSKGTIKRFSCATNSGFPAGTNIAFKWVRALFEKRDPSAPNTNVWKQINQGSPHVDLDITGTGNCNGGITISPVTIQAGTTYTNSVGKSVSIENGQVYDFKLGVVDQARNAYLYTPDGQSREAAGDTDCQTGNGSPNTGANNPTTGIAECHTIRPAVVAGVLANKVNCFIATASYGSPMAEEVDSFRHFRDTYLIPTKLGLEFVRWYYNEGPKYAAFIRQNDTYRAIARGFLWLPLQFAKISNSYGIFAGLAFLFGSLAAPFVLLALLLNKKRSTRTHA